VSVSEIVIKVIGIILAIVGLGLILSVLGLNVIGVHLATPWPIEILVGLVVLGVGVYIVRGGSIGL